MKGEELVLQHNPKRDDTDGDLDVTISHQGSWEQRASRLGRVGCAPAFRKEILISPKRMLTEPAARGYKTRS